MSLINEALKKAQRSRTKGADGSLPPMPGSSHIARRGQARSANMMVLLASSAVVLVVLSVVVTIYLLNRQKPKAPAPTLVLKPAVAGPADESAPATVKPMIPAPPEATSAAEAPLSSTTNANPPLATAPPGTPATASPPAPAAPPSSSRPPPLPDLPGTTEPAPTIIPATATAGQGATQVPTPVNLRPDERIAAYIESLRISGVRAQGADSRILINERVYRINDIIERTLGIRLLTVTPGTLTFADANGTTYIKQI